MAEKKPRAPSVFFPTLETPNFKQFKPHIDDMDLFKIPLTQVQQKLSLNMKNPFNWVVLWARGAGAYKRLRKYSGLDAFGFASYKAKMFAASLVLLSGFRLFIGARNAHVAGGYWPPMRPFEWREEKKGIHH